MGNVLYRERADGVVIELQEFLSWWDQHGDFPLRVQVDGGLRKDASKQLHFFLSGMSKARTLNETPHGPGGAVDVAPADWDGLTVTAEDYAKFCRIGVVAQERGLVWGGRWKKAFPPTKANPYGGDLCHLEIEDWRALPYQPLSTRTEEGP